MCFIHLFGAGRTSLQIFIQDSNPTLHGPAEGKPPKPDLNNFYVWTMIIASDEQPLERVGGHTFVGTDEPWKMPKAWDKGGQMKSTLIQIVVCLFLPTCRENAWFQWDIFFGEFQEFGFHGNKLPGCQHSLQIYQSQLVGSCLGGRDCWWGKLESLTLLEGFFQQGRSSPLKIYRGPKWKGLSFETYDHHFSGAFAVKLLEGMNVVILMKPQKTWRIGKPFVEPKKYGRCWYRKSSYLKRWSRSFVQREMLGTLGSVP